MQINIRGVTIDPYVEVEGYDVPHEGFVVTAFRAWHYGRRKTRRIDHLLSAAQREALVEHHLELYA